MAVRVEIGCGLFGSRWVGVIGGKCVMPRYRFPDSCGGIFGCVVGLALLVASG